MTDRGKRYLELVDEVKQDYKDNVTKSVKNYSKKVTK